MEQALAAVHQAAPRSARDSLALEIVSQADSVPGTAEVKVTAEGFFGPLVKNYVFDFVYDVNGTLTTLLNGL